MSGRRPTFGINEWFGRTFADLSPVERLELETYSHRSVKSNIWLTQPSWPKCLPRGGVTPCTKLGGVCSMIRHLESPSGAYVTQPPPVTVCPHRFEEPGSIEVVVAEYMLGCTDPVRIKEIPFLTPIRGSFEASEQKDESGSVGRIDDILVDPSRYPLNWCAVEVQAVYHSGDSWNREFAAVVATEGELHDWPSGNRRPDFRSSSAKRLMPQLQTKVPTLRRWGKKMAVVVDEAFFAALAPMETVPHLSNCDIAWFVMRYERTATGWEMSLGQPILTTLERAVEGLTAGVPVTLNEFEESIRRTAKRHFRVDLPAGS